MRTARFFLLVSILAFVGLTLFAIRHHVDQDVHERYKSALLRLRTLESDVDESVLSKRVGITHSFDPLAEMMRQTDAVHRELRVVPSFLPPGPRARVLDAIDQSAKLQKERAAYVDHFKTEESALEAAIHILGPETTTFADAAEKVGGRGLADHAKKVHVELLELLTSREVGHRAEIDDAVAALTAESAKWPESVKRDAERLVSHTRRVMEKLVRVDRLTQAIVTEDAVAHALAVDQEYVEGFEAARTIEGRSVIGLFVLAFFALASASLYVIARLRASAAELGKATAQLSSALVELQEERTKEKELAELKTRFVAMTSHEFRTPLSVINSSAELLHSYGDKWDKEKRGEHFARIHRAISGMTSMLERILLIGKTDAGMLEFHPTTLALGRLCLEIATAAELADGGKRSVEKHVTDDVGAASADEQLVRHVLENLLSNAIKYSPEGARVRFDATRDGDDVVLVVEDHGIGIPEADRARLFDNFHRAKNALHIPGTGLGLSVVKRAVELHGGTIAFESTAGEGTTFTARLRAPRDARSGTDEVAKQT